MNSLLRISIKVALSIFCILLVLAIRYTHDYSMTNTQTENSLLEGIAAQDPVSLRYCYKNFGPAVIHWIAQNGGNNDQAQDIFQDGMIALYMNIRKGTFEKRNAKLSTYLLQICKYKWYDYLKSSKHKKEVSLADRSSFENIPELTIDAEAIGQQKLVHKALARLKNQCREILHSFYWEKKSMEDIARQLKMQVASVKNGKYRCMQALKKEFANIQNTAG